MARRFTRRTLVGWLARSTAAAATASLLSALGGAPARAAGSFIARPTAEPAHAAVAAARRDGPVQVRMADLVLAGRELRAGNAEGIRRPAQGGDGWALTPERPGATYTTPALRAAFPCSHVGVHWRHDGGDESGLTVELRASRDGQTWMPWRQVRRDLHGPDRPAPEAEDETFGALVSGRLGSWFQVRLTFAQAGPEVAAISALTLTCLDSRRAEPIPHVSRSDTPRAGAPGPDADSSLLRLRAGIAGFLERVVSREAWGADESLRFKDGVNQWPAAYVPPSLLVVHHTATDNDYGDAEAEVRAIYAYHAVTQGWGDIGYHLLIDSSGRVYEGRRGREPDASGVREIVSEDVVAGHALDYNYGSVGIALLGNFQTRPPGQAMLDALAEALAFMAQRSGIDPTQTISYPRARGDGSALWRDRLAAISGHRDCIPTECPGDLLYPRLPSLRQEVEARLGARGPWAQIRRGPTDRNAWPGDLVFEWSAAGGAVEFSARLAGWQRIPGSDRIEPLSGYSDDERPAWGPWRLTSALSVPLPPNARGLYLLLVRARDADGHEGRVVARWPLVVDRHVVVDDVDALRVSHTGAWERRGEILGYYGQGYQAAKPGQDVAAFRWQLAVPEDGVYRLQASWTEAPNRTARAVYRLGQAGQPLGEATVSQQEPGGRWAALLDAPLAARIPCTVELAAADDGVTVADAVRLVLVASP